jgi:hypothetical protein
LLSVFLSAWNAPLNSHPHVVGTKRNIFESNNATVMTTKRPSLLRHHVLVYDISHAVQNACLLNNEDQENSFEAVDNHVRDNVSNAAPDMLPTAEVFSYDPFMFRTIRNGQLLYLNSWMT